MNFGMICLCIAIIFVLLLVITMRETVVFYNKIFGTRLDETSSCYEYIIGKYPDFLRKQVTFASNQGQQLNGYFYYRSKEVKGVIIFVHGLGAGHQEYLGEIEYLSRNGYLIFSYDGTGINDSQGEKLVGLLQSPIDLKYAITYLSGVKQIQGYPVMLYGHSWGGFGVSTVGNFTLDMDIKGIVSTGGFERTSKITRQRGKRILGRKIELCMPFVKVYEKILFGGKIATITGIDGLKNTTAKVMICHGVRDGVASYDDNYQSYYEEFKNNPRFTFLSVDCGCHNVQMIEVSFARKHEIKKIKQKLDKSSKEYAQLELEEVSLCLAVNEKTMGKVLDFYQSLV